MLHHIRNFLAGIIRLLTWPLGRTGRRRLLRVLRQGMATPGFDEVIADSPRHRAVLLLGRPAFVAGTNLADQRA